MNATEQGVAAASERLPVRGAGFIDPHVLASIGNLDLLARIVVDGFVSGLHRAVFRGVSTEFAEHRPYAPGDDIRQLDWRLYARTDRLSVKTYEAETNADLVLALDISSSMTFEGGGVRKLDYARFLLASLTHLASRQRDRIGLATFDDSIVSYVPPSVRHRERVMHTLGTVEPRPRGDLGKSLERLASALIRRGIVVVVSDFYLSPEDAVRALESLHVRGHDVIAIHLVDPVERDLELGERDGRGRPGNGGPPADFARDPARALPGAGQGAPRLAQSPVRVPRDRLRLFRHGAAAGPSAVSLPLAARPLGPGTMSGALLSPWMLLGLAALAAPVIAHLVHRREREGAPFPSLMFLRRVPSPVRRHLKIRDPWLLLLRCLLLLTLVLAFCDPRWFGVDEPVATAPTGRDVVVLLDRSYSMAYGERWSEAVALAESSLSALAPGDRAALVAFDDAVQVLSPLTGELGSLPALLASLRPGSRGTDFAAALAAGENLFLEDGSDQRELILVSDLQRVGLETREPRLGEGIQLSVVRAIGADDPNLTLLSAQVDTVRGELLAHVGSTGGDREVTSDLGLEIEGHDTASAVVSLGPGEEQIVTFPLVLADGTASHLRVHIADDALNADNELDLIAAPPPVVRALIVEPNGTGASSALFLEEAMSLLPMPRVAVERIEVSNLDSGTIARFDLVAFAGVPIPQGGVGEAVTRHVDGGGGLLLFGHASSSSRRWTDRNDAPKRRVGPCHRACRGTSRAPGFRGLVRFRSFLRFGSATRRTGDRSR